jgi:hypothetical protein
MWYSIWFSIGGSREGSTESQSCSIPTLTETSPLLLVASLLSIPRPNFTLSDDEMIIQMVFMYSTRRKGWLR